MTTLMNVTWCEKCQIQKNVFQLQASPDKTGGLPGDVAHVYNPSCSGARDQEDFGSKPAMG
jgi:hypothetical protein